MISACNGFLKTAVVVALVSLSSFAFELRTVDAALEGSDANRVQVEPWLAENEMETIGKDAMHSLRHGFGGDRSAKVPGAADVDEDGSETDSRVWAVSGATGRTGMLAYDKLVKKYPGTAQVRAIVRNGTKASSVLECGKCSEAEGVYVADIVRASASSIIGKNQDRKALDRALKGAFGLVILTSSFPVKRNGKWSFPKGATPKEVDWRGAVVQIKAAKAAGVKRIVLVSTAGTTKPQGIFSELFGMGGHISFYKLNAEAFLMGSGIEFDIVKPCGLTDNSTFKFGSQVYKCDEMTHFTAVPLVTREHVADIVVAAAAQTQQPAQSLRFEFCSDPLKPLMVDNTATLLKQAAQDFKC